MIPLFELVSSLPITPALPVRAAATTSTGNSNEFTVTAAVAGDKGNGITLLLVDPGVENSALSIEVSHTNAITVSLETDGDGVITTTADALVAAVNAAAPIVELSSEDTGVCEALTLSLEGGVSGIILKNRQAVYDSDYIYMAIGQTTEVDSSNLRKIALLDFVET